MSFVMMFLQLFSPLSVLAMFLEIVIAADTVPFAPIIPFSFTTREENASPGEAETRLLARQGGEGHCIDSWKKPCDIPGYCAEVCCGYGNGGKSWMCLALIELRVEQYCLFLLQLLCHRLSWCWCYY